MRKKMKEEMTVYELLVLAEQNFDTVMAVWTEIGNADPSTTMATATIEWAKRNGREIVLVPSKVLGAILDGIPT